MRKENHDEVIMSKGTEAGLRMGCLRNSTDSNRSGLWQECWAGPAGTALGCNSKVLRLSVGSGVLFYNFLYFDSAGSCVAVWAFL